MFTSSLGYVGLFAGVKRYTCVFPSPLGFERQIFLYARVFTGTKKYGHSLVRRFYAPVMLCTSVPRCSEVRVRVRQSSGVHARVCRH